MNKLIMFLSCLYEILHNLKVSTIIWSNITTETWIYGNYTKENSFVQII